ncbi:hypothetical protein [Chitinophaga qingshengii]|uniref:DUF4145 domain-containing protein n=1 Tax=Chitinophaga qingshengii TaxID=1569794 RepID=A0ABR7TX98_9BACT|nr:hypothetical protein [Chitinophaga qingshengii]MBC9935063.1 hypothetical protein [Chitinophaga qingshengii]
MSNISNLDKYKSELASLISKGDQLLISIKYECYPKEIEQSINQRFGKEADKILKNLFPFNDHYQTWYSESKLVIKVLLPDRLEDFIKQYEKPKSRKELSHENYVIEDYMINLRATRGIYKDVVVDTTSAIPKYLIQLNILKSVQQRFSSSLFDIKQLVQADLFDSELESSKELLKKNFYRAAGAIAGVVLEKHLKQVCLNHNLTITTRNATINNLNELLKQQNIIEIPQWRTIQFLGDIRNQCDHHTGTEPTKEQIDDLIKGTDKLTKTLF